MVPVAPPPGATPLCPAAPPDLRVDDSLHDLEILSGRQIPARPWPNRRAHDSCRHRVLGPQGAGHDDKRRSPPSERDDECRLASAGEWCGVLKPASAGSREIGSLLRLQPALRQGWMPTWVKTIRTSALPTARPEGRRECATLSEIRILFSDIHLAVGPKKDYKFRT